MAIGNPGVNTSDRASINDRLPVGTMDDTALGAGVVTLASLKAKPAGATAVMMQTIAQAVYYTMDGSTPSATHGYVLAAGAAPVIIGVKNASLVKFLRAADGALLQLQWMK